MSDTTSGIELARNRFRPKPIPSAVTDTLYGV